MRLALLLFHLHFYPSNAAIANYIQTNYRKIKVSCNAVGNIKSEPVVADVYNIADGSEDLKYRYPPRNPAFETTNVITKNLPVPTSFSKYWDLFLPDAPKKSLSTIDFSTLLIPGKFRRLSKGDICLDVTVEYKSADEGAAALIRKCISENCDSGFIKRNLSPDELNLVTEYISNILDFFESMTRLDVKEERHQLYKVRLVSSQGPIGQKCPRWHVDHVPVRLVMSLLGPGCVYIPHDAEHSQFETNCDEKRLSLRTKPILDRDTLNELDVDDTEIANGIIVPGGEEDVAIQAKEGEAVLLMGREWEKSIKDARFGNEVVKAAAHRSPILGMKEKRVLLTVDLVPSLQQ